MEGGHNIEEEVIRRRYFAGIKNLFEIYLPIVDEAIILDNSRGNSKKIFEKINGEEFIVNIEKFNLLKTNVK